MTCKSVSLQTSTETLSYVSWPEMLVLWKGGPGKPSVVGGMLTSNDIGEGAEGRNTFFRNEMQMLVQTIIYCKLNY